MKVDRAAWKLAVRRVSRLCNGLLHPTFPEIVFLLVKNSLGFGGFHSKLAHDLPADLNAEGALPRDPSNSDLIPPIIFQTWKSRVDIPANYRYWRSTFLRLNRGFDCILWDDDDNRRFIAAEFPWFLPVYNAYPKEIFRADAVRPFFLFRYGGYYADMDSECLRPLAEFSDPGAVILGRMGSDTSFEHSVPNAIMASKPFQLFWLLFIAIMIEKVNQIGGDLKAWSAKPELLTGPIALKEAFDFYSTSSEADIRRRAEAVVSSLPAKMQDQVQFGKLTLLDQESFYPLDWTNPIHRLLRGKLMATRTLLDHDTARKLYPKSLMVTYWSHSW